jgi:hypothetical protein
MTAFVQEARAVRPFNSILNSATIALALLALGGCAAREAPVRSVAATSEAALISPHSSTPYTRAQSQKTVGRDIAPALEIVSRTSASPEDGAPATEESPALDLGAPIAADFIDPGPGATPDPVEAPAPTIVESTELAAPGPDAPALPTDLALPEILETLHQVMSTSSIEQGTPLLRDALLLAALKLVDWEDGIDDDLIDRLTQDQRDLLAAYEDHFRRLGNEAAGSAEPGAILRLIDDLRAAIEGNPPLAIPAARLCTRIDGFGRYEAFERNEFPAGKSQPVALYTEVERFSSTLTEDGLWKTDLSQSLEIRARAAHPDSPTAWHLDWQPAPDITARRRTDFFISHIVTIPDSLAPGEYELIIRVRDDTTGEVAESVVEFSIGTE